MSKKFKIPASHSPSGKDEVFIANHDSNITNYLRYIIACCDFLRHFRMFDGDFKGNIEIMKADFPWAIKKHNFLRYRYWVYSGFQDGDLIIIHDKMSKHESIATLTHELMHYFYKKLNERKIQKKAIENIQKIIQNYSLITHPNNEKNFKSYGISSSLLRVEELQEVLKYLHVSLKHVF
ncbi:hypothetical protein KY334_06835 [Candidatus Woesearchaeota archaeon]|nr:hypothetical protein [Candidatus Woesearchaeota archaeon]